MAPFMRKSVALLLLVLPAGLTAMSGGSVRAGEPGGDAPALVAVRVPPDAELWFEGSKMAPGGTVRVFRTPPLAPGKLYAYEVRVRWSVDGREDTRTRTVLVSPGESVRVDFTGPVFVAAPGPPQAPAVAKTR